MYCFDTSAFIDLKNYYASDIFVKLWKNIEEVVLKGLIISPDQVFDELERGQDELFNWVKRNKSHIFNQGLDINIQNNLRLILATYSSTIDINNPKTEADTFVVAIGMKNKCTVVSQERKNPQGKLRIPDLCDAFKIKHISLQDYIREQGWKFN